MYRMFHGSLFSIPFHTGLASEFILPISRKKAIESNAEALTPNEMIKFETGPI